MSGLSYDELEAYACGIYSHEPGPDGTRVLRALPDPRAMESRSIPAPKLWTAPYASRFRERFTPTPSCSSDDDAAYETAREDAESEYEDCLPITPKSELRNGGVGLPYNKNREVQIIDSVFRGGPEFNGVDANIDLTLIDGSCPALGSHRNAGLPPIPAKNPQRQVSVQKLRERQDSSFFIPPLAPRRHSSHINDCSNNDPVAGLYTVSCSSSKSVTPPQYTERHPARRSHTPTNSIGHVEPASLRSGPATKSSFADDADDEADDDYSKPYSINLPANETRRLSSSACHYQLKRNSHEETTSLHDRVSDLFHHDRIVGQEFDLQQYPHGGSNYRTACDLQRGKQSLDDAYMMDLMHVHPAVRIEVIKRSLQIPRESAAAPPGPEKQERRSSSYRFNSLDDLVEAGAGEDVSN